jgi:hypothetical protein
LWNIAGEEICFDWIHATQINMYVFTASHYNSVRQFDFSTSVVSIIITGLPHIIAKALDIFDKCNRNCLQGIEITIISEVCS